MIITGTRDGQKLYIGITDDEMPGAEFEDARIIIAALTSGFSEAHVQPGTRVRKLVDAGVIREVGLDAWTLKT